MENTSIYDTKLKLSNLDEYDEAFKKFIIESSDKLMFEIEPILSMCTFENREVIGKMQTQINDEWIESKNGEQNISLTISNEVIENTNIEDYMVIAYDLAKQNSNLIIPQVLKLLDEVCDKSGQTVDSGGEGFSYDLFLDMLEKIEISFDENNEPIKPTLIMHPDVAEKIKEIKPTKEQELREKLIWERKKADFIAKKRNRRLL